jgi:DMSO/TMAO reductase YedYZ molybdopterin-dependent catalytic subunit
MIGTRRFRRAGRRTNLALLVLVAGAFLTGWLAFAAGTRVPATLATVSHGLLGLGVVALVPWKTVIIRRARLIWLASLLLVTLIVVCLVAGFVQVFVGYSPSRISPIQVHVGAAVVAVPLLAWHVLRHRRQRLGRVDLSRRNLLRTGAFAVGVIAGYLGIEAVGRAAGLPSASRLATGSHELAPKNAPATIWLFDRVPTVSPDHRVDVAGTMLGATELASKSTQVRARLDCTSGWYADAVWTAVSLADLIDSGRLAAATSIEVASVTGYRRRFPADQAGVLWLATSFEGQPLQPAYGAPVRLVAPGRRGFWWVKWVRSVELSDRPAALQSPFPLQ